MIQIRQQSFETNSSSEHALILLTENEYKDWKSGKVFLLGHDKVISVDEVLRKMHEDPKYNGDYSEEDIKEYLYDIDAEEYTSWEDNAWDVEIFYKNGVIAISYEYGC